MYCCYQLYVSQIESNSLAIMGKLEVPYSQPSQYGFSRFVACKKSPLYNTWLYFPEFVIYFSPCFLPLLPCLFSNMGHYVSMWGEVHTFRDSTFHSNVCVVIPYNSTVSCYLDKQDFRISVLLTKGKENILNHGLF